MEDKYTRYVCDKYDIQDRAKSVVDIQDFPLYELDSTRWQILCILGRSGAGKTTILNTIKSKCNVRDCEAFVPDNSKPCISQFPNLTPKEVTDLFCGIGLSSVPTWLRPPCCLSNGERARFNIAAAIATHKDNEPVVIDEFTSVVNRDIAKSMSFALQKYIRKHDVRVIIASCHYDILEWLQPDLLFNLNKMRNGKTQMERNVYTDDVEQHLLKSEVLTQDYEVPNL